MNADRRRAINKLSSQLDEIKGEIESLRDEEQDYIDNMPESFRQGEKGDLADQAISNLDEAVSSVESAIDSLNSAQD